MNTSTSLPSSLSQAPLLVEASASGVKCNGGSGVLGHPEVYYSFDGKPSVSCIYCGQVFAKKST